MKSCPLHVTPEEVEEIKNYEAVLVREYERKDGSRFAEVISMGSIDEMKSEAERPEILLRFDGSPELIGSIAVLVSALLPPQGEG